MTLPNETPAAEPVEAAAAAAEAAPAAQAETPSILGAAVEGGEAAAEAAPDAESGDADTPPAVDEAGGDVVTPYEGLAAPEGTSIDADTLTAITPILRGLGVADTAAANGVLEQVAPVINGIVERQLESFVSQQEVLAVQQRRDWHDAARNDPEVGGANFDKSVSAAALAMDRLFSPDFRDVLRATGFDNHPEMLRGLAKAGTELRSDTIHRGDGGKQTLSTAQKIYDPAFQPKS